MRKSHSKAALTQGRLFATIALLVVVAMPTWAAPTDVNLGQAFDFGILAGTTVTNTGPSVVFGHVGVSTGTSITGFLPGMMVGGTGHLNDEIAQRAQDDLDAAYSVVAGQTVYTELTNPEIGGLTLTEGVYRFSSSAQLTGLLTLDAKGDPNARFHFQIGSTLTTAAASSVRIINGGSADNVFFQVGSSATLGTGTDFTGNILAAESITLTTGASITDGRALARNGAVTLDTNNLGATVVPEPSTGMLLGGVGLTAFAVLRRRGKK